MIIAHTKENYSFLYLILNMVTWLHSLTSSNDSLGLSMAMVISSALSSKHACKLRKPKLGRERLKHTCFLPLRARESHLRRRLSIPARWTHLTAERRPGGGSRPALSPRPSQSRRGPAGLAGKDQSAASLLLRPLPGVGGKVSSRPLDNFPGKMAQR